MTVASFFFGTVAFATAVLPLTSSADTPAEPQNACYAGAYRFADSSYIVISPSDEGALRYRVADGRSGRLYPDADERLVFLGTLSLGDEEAPLAYGEKAERDMVGIVERVAPFRWRLVIPFPRKESRLDVFELVPVTP